MGHNESKFIIPDNVTWKNFDSGIVLLKLNSGNYYTLNETSTLIWRGIMDGITESEILTQILDEYDCGEDCARADMYEQISFFLEEGLIV
jgi:hypothetical protein